VERRRFVLALLAGLSWPPAAVAQPANKVWRIAYLSGASLELDQPRLAGFRQGLQELGYLEGKNVVIEEKYAGGRPDRLPGLAEEMAKRKPDLFVVYGVPAAANAAKKASATIPIVFTVSPDPVADGLVSSLARPGGQLTGMSDLHSATVTKRLELLKEVAPSLTRIAILFNPGSPANVAQLKDIEAAAPAFGFTLTTSSITRPEDVERAFSSMKSQRADAVMILGDFLLGTQRKLIIDHATRAKLPTVFTTREAAQAGGLISYGTNFFELWRRAATYADKIFKGAKPGDLPVEQPTKFEVVVNLKTAKAIGIAVPRSLLLRADQVIE
jgi:putative tryptophan/tyrosine transport system substrate-binding protein